MRTSPKLMRAMEKVRDIKSRRLPIFPEGCPSSIFGTSELNFRVRDGNGWNLTVINTGLLVVLQDGSGWCCSVGIRTGLGVIGAPPGTRTRDPLIKSQLLYQLS